MNLLRKLAMILFATALASCGRETEIQSDFDRSADFAAYKTFGYATPLGTEVDGYSDEITQSFKAATRRELEARGYRFVDADPDLLVNFGALLEKKGQSPVANTQHVGYYGYRRTAVYKAWPSYVYERNGEKYTKGTLNVDLVDARRKQLVWEGVAIGRVKDESLSNPGPGIDQVVREIFAKYTYRAGG
jgi:hypothetical protein